MKCQLHDNLHEMPNVSEGDSLHEIPKLRIFLENKNILQNVVCSNFHNILEESNFNFRYVIKIFIQSTMVFRV